MEKIMIGIVAPIVRDGTIAPAKPIYRNVSDLPGLPKDVEDAFPWGELAEIFAAQYAKYLASERASARECRKRREENRKRFREIMEGKTANESDE